MSLALTVLRAAGLAMVGLYAGGVLFVVIAPSVTRLPGPAYVRYWQALNADHGRTMPPLLLATVAVLLVAAVISWRHGRLVFGLGVAALILVALTIVLTVAALEPLNQLANTWVADRLPVGWHESRRQWSHLHLVRTALALAAFGCLITAQVIDRSHP
ncbi:DUF1772 domain-containing protein [Nonomuraea sp. GTA35]|uniref:DUF1772 domain-containing protein n=1 Tax=Nonomuraea sp. GTA35 TaxID=1676746 RepID=UPI0035BF54FF